MNFGNMLAASILVCFLPTILSITGYACGKGHLNITTYATAGVQECESMAINSNHSEVAFQLLYRVDYEDTGVMRCRVRVEQHIRYYGTGLPDGNLLPFSLTCKERHILLE